LRQVYEFGLLEDFDHLYRYANILDMLEGKKAAKIVGELTEITPGRPTIFEHRDPRDDVRRPMTALAAHPQSLLNALTVMSAEQQTMNFYMTIGNRYMEPLARALYLEIGMIEEQHVTQYESILDPASSLIENLLLHEFNECWIYWSFMQEEPDPRVRALYEKHLAMEIEHLRIAGELMRQIERRDPEELLAAGFDKPMVFKENKKYVRSVLEKQVDLTARDTDFVPITDLPADHRYFVYQSSVNAGENPSETVIKEAIAANGEEYRYESEGDNPVPGLCREKKRKDRSTEYAKRLAA
jgi:hypothetical protein